MLLKENELFMIHPTDNYQFDFLTTMTEKSSFCCNLDLEKKKSNTKIFFLIHIQNFLWKIIILIILLLIVMKKKHIYESLMNFISVSKKGIFFFWKTVSPRRKRMDVSTTFSFMYETNESMYSNT